MPKLRTARFALIAALPGFCAAPPATAQSPSAPVRAADPARSDRARQLLASVVDAVGGEAALRGLGTIRRRVTLDWLDPGQQPRPWHGSYDLAALPVGDRVQVEVVANHATGQFTKREQRGGLTGEPLTIFDAGGPTGGFQTITDRAKVPMLRRFSASEFGIVTAVEMRLLPEALLLWALRSPRLDLVEDRTGGGRKEPALSFVDPGGRTLTLHIDPATRLPKAVSWSRPHQSFGQTVSEIAFADFRRSGRLKLPFRYVVRTAGRPTFNYRIRTITQESAAPLRLAPPERTVPYENGPGAPKLNSLGRGVYEVLGAYNSAFAIFPDYILMVDAPIDENYTKKVVELIRTVEPSKPIRLVATHFHYDHIGGIRYAVSEGMTIMATSHARTGIERMLDPSLKFGDTLSKKPRQPIFEMLGARTVLEGGGQRVELLDIGPIRHSEENVAVHFPTVGALLAADVWDIHAPAVAVPTNDALLMFDKLRDAQVRVERFIPAHGVPVTRDVLAAGLQRRSQRGQAHKAAGHAGATAICRLDHGP